MKQKQLLRTLLAAVCLLVGTNAWGDKTFLPTMTGTVGPTDLTGAWWTNCSKAMTIADGETYVISLINHNIPTSNYSHANFYIEMSDWTEQGYCDAQIDGGANPWGGTLFTQMTQTGKWDDYFDTETEWNAAYNGVKVTITVSRSGNVITASHAATCKDANSTNYSGSFSTTYEGSSDVSFYIVAAGGAYQEITNVVYTEADGTTTHTYASAIDALPFSRTWTASDVDGTSPFDAGTVKTGTNVTALSVNNTTANAYFDSDVNTSGNQPYTLNANEKVTVTFTAYHGWMNKGGNSTVQLINSDGVALVSYTYSTANTNFPDVSFGGSTAAGFETFTGRSIWSGTNGANGFAPGGNNPRPYVNTAGWNPAITMTVSKNGYVSFRLQNSQANVDVNYNTILNTENVKMDIASIRIIDAVTDADRSIGISNLSITSEVAAKHNVTFAYTDTDGNSLSSIKPNSFALVDDETNVESLITEDLKASFYNGDNSIRYDYNSYSVPEDATTVTGDVTITLKFAPKAHKDYTVKAIDSNSNELFEIASGDAYVGENITVQFNKYYKSGTTLLKADAIDDSKKQFSYTFAISESENDKTITYKTTSINNVIFYSEGEDLSTSGIVTVGTLSQRGSGRKGIAGTNLVVTSLPAGTYKVTVNLGGKAKQGHSVKAGENTILTVSTEEGGDNYLSDGVLKTITSSEFTLTEATDITYTGGYSTSTANNAHGLDYIYIVKAGSESKTITSAGWATYCSPYVLDLANATGLTGAYIVTGGENGVLTKTSVMNGTVPANTGLLLKGNEGTATIPIVASSSTDVSANKLVGVTAETQIGANTGYVLLKENDVLGFYKNNKAFTLGANTAYLPTNFDQNATARASYLLFDDMTGISNVAGDKVKTNGAVYNLNGQRVNNPTKGIYIIDGIKVAME